MPVKKPVLLKTPALIVPALALLETFRIPKLFRTIMEAFEPFNYPQKSKKDCRFKIKVEVKAAS